MSSPPKTALVIGASGYIGGAVARVFADASYLTLGLIRAGSSDPHGLLSTHNVRTVIGSAADVPAAVASIQAHSKTLNVIVIATEDRSQAHFDGTIDLVSSLSKVSNSEGIKPLVIFTSGCKDYGPGPLNGSPGLQAQTEESPLRTPPSLVPRAQNALKFLGYPDLFDAVVTRPTSVHGYSSSYWGGFFDLGKAAKERHVKLVLPGDARTILHSVHVDDCADAYLALAEHADRSQVAGQIFNISAGQKYETLSSYASALQDAFGLGAGSIECVAQELSAANVMFAWSQWVGSEKIRKLTGWTDSRPMFTEDLPRYKKDFEEAREGQDVTFLRMRPRLEGAVKLLFPVAES